HEIDYRAEAHAGDELVVATWVERIARVKAWRSTLVVRPSDETVVCTASTLWVLVDLARRRPIRIPATMVGALDPRMRPGTTNPCEVTT
ncbi:MAG: acyl-CoA thioesterase, partial [Phycisphaerae bacterium]|nr:acyl-CoA thioesterase [Phycisphaerae bacterium]